MLSDGHTQCDGGTTGRVAVHHDEQEVSNADSVALSCHGEQNGNQIFDFLVSLLLTPLCETRASDTLEFDAVAWGFRSVNAALVCTHVDEYERTRRVDHGPLRVLRPYTKYNIDYTHNIVVIPNFTSNHSKGTSKGPRTQC